MKVNEAAFHRLDMFAEQAPLELSAFESVAEKTLSFRRREIIRAQGEPIHEVYLLVEGWVASSMNVLNGRRQIVKINLAGDLLGIPSLCLASAALTFETLTPATVHVIPLEAFAKLFMQMPRMALSMLLMSQQEGVRLMDRLASVGQTKAVQRLSAFLLHIHDRLTQIGAVQDQSFDLPLTQGELAEIVGLTFVHVNRSLRELDRSGMIERSGKHFRLVDLDGLRELAGLPQRSFVRDPEWLDANPARRQAGIRAPR